MENRHWKIAAPDRYLAVQRGAQDELIAKAEARGMERGLEQAAMMADRSAGMKMDALAFCIRTMKGIHVSPSGNDANAGSEAAPKETPL